MASLHVMLQLRPKFRITLLLYIAIALNYHSTPPSNSATNFVCCAGLLLHLLLPLSGHFMSTVL